MSVTFDGASPWALEDRFVHAAVEARLFGTTAEPLTLGRYHAVRPIGAGAMGQLVLAYDPSLQRHVALKLLAPHLTDSAEARTRIVREARAMAKLSDPHIAQVYEVGEADGRVFVAMEYVEGENLRAWIDAGPHGVREIVQVFVQAGAGLAAAHRKGLVHRDFKPENVVLEQGGRARVVDFGLAQAGNAIVPSTEHGLDAVVSGGSALTHAGTILGTPAYMAPEQWNGGAVTPKSDQFSFCVALFEALASRRPFEDRTPADRQPSSEGDRIAALPPAVPRWLARVLHRGLARDPAARFPDMPTLLLALDPARRARRRVAVAIGVLLVLLPLGVHVLRRDPCRDVAAPIHASFGPPTRLAITTALGRVDRPWIEATAQAVLPRLDDHVEAWGQAARAVCAAGQREPARRGCLAHARGRLDALVQRLETGDPSLVVHAAVEAELLPDPRACLDAPSISAFTDEAASMEIARRDALAHLTQLDRSLGALSTQAMPFGAAIEAGHTAAAEALAAAQAIDHVPLLARVLWSTGRLHQRDGDAIRAEAVLRRARVLAHEARDERLAAAITIDLVYAVSRDRDRGHDADRLADEAEGMLTAIGEPPVLAARLRSHRGSALAHARKADRARAVAEHERAVTLLLETLGPEHPDAIAALGNLGTALNYADRPAEAQVRLEQAIAGAERAFGPDHPRTAVLLGTLGLARLRQDDLEGAEQHLRRALALQEAALGPNHGDVDKARYNLVSVLRRREHHEEAVALLELGLAHRRAVLDPSLDPWHAALGDSLLALGRMDEARIHLEAALQKFERHGAPPADFANVQLSLARALAANDPVRARVLAELARDDARAAEHDALVAEIEAFLASTPP